MRRFTFVLGFLLLAAPASAASLRICMVDPLPADTETLEFSIDAAVIAADLLPGSTLTGTTRCKIIPFPATLTRGDHAATIRAFNVIGEGGPVSAPVTFRAPTIPAGVTNVTVQAVAP
jgi:hypothetical protein